MKYSVGQILFVIMNKKLQVYPMMVIEQITKKTLKGEEINYVLQAGPDSNKTLLLNEVDGEIFDSDDEAKKTLFSRAKTQIEKIVDESVKNSKEWYLTNHTAHPAQKIEEVKKDNGYEEVMKIQLPDGTIANLRNINFAE